MAYPPDRYQELFEQFDFEIVPLDLSDLNIPELPSTEERGPGRKSKGKPHYKIYGRPRRQGIGRRWLRPVDLDEDNRAMDLIRRRVKEIHPCTDHQAEFDLSCQLARRIRLLNKQRLMDVEGAPASGPSVSVVNYTESDMVNMKVMTLRRRISKYSQDNFSISWSNSRLSSVTKFLPYLDPWRFYEVYKISVGFMDLYLSLFGRYHSARAFIELGVSLDTNPGPLPERVLTFYKLELNDIFDLQKYSLKFVHWKTPRIPTVVVTFDRIAVLVEAKTHPETREDEPFPEGSFVHVVASVLDCPGKTSHLHKYMLSQNPRRSFWRNPPEWTCLRAVKHPGGVSVAGLLKEAREYEKTCVFDITNMLRNELVFGQDRAQNFYQDCEQITKAPEVLQPFHRAIFSASTNERFDRLVTYEIYGTDQRLVVHVSIDDEFCALDLILVNTAFNVHSRSLEVVKWHHLEEYPGRLDAKFVGDVSQLRGKACIIKKWNIRLWAHMTMGPKAVLKLFIYTV